MSLNETLTERVNEGERLLNYLERTRTTMTVTAFAARIGVSASNFETAKYLQDLCSKFKRHQNTCETPEEIQHAVAAVEEKASRDEVLGLRDLVAKLGTERRVLELNHRTQIQRLEAEILRLRRELATARGTFASQSHVIEPTSLPHMPAARPESVTRDADEFPPF